MVSEAERREYRAELESYMAASMVEEPLLLQTAANGGSAHPIVDENWPPALPLGITDLGDYMTRGQVIDAASDPTQGYESHAVQREHPSATLPSPDPVRQCRNALDMEFFKHVEISSRMAAHTREKWLTTFTLDTERQGQTALSGEASAGSASVPATSNVHAIPTTLAPGQEATATQSQKVQHDSGVYNVMDYFRMKNRHLIPNDMKGPGKVHLSRSFFVQLWKQQTDEQKAAFEQEFQSGNWPDDIRMAMIKEAVESVRKGLKFLDQNGVACYSLMLCPDPKIMSPAVVKPKKFESGRFTAFKKDYFDMVGLPENHMENELAKVLTYSRNLYMMQHYETELADRNSGFVFPESLGLQSLSRLWTEAETFFKGLWTDFAKKHPRVHTYFNWEKWHEDFRVVGLPEGVTFKRPTEWKADEVAKVVEQFKRDRNSIKFVPLMETGNAQDDGMEEADDVGEGGLVEEASSEAPPSKHQLINSARKWNAQKWAELKAIPGNEDLLRRLWPGSKKLLQFPYNQSFLRAIGLPDGLEMQAPWNYEYNELVVYVNAKPTFEVIVPENMRCQLALYDGPDAESSSGMPLGNTYANLNDFDSSELVVVVDGQGQRSNVECIDNSTRKDVVFVECPTVKNLMSANHTNNAVLGLGWFEIFQSNKSS